ncbi:MAG: glycoside hydrolase, partial [Planctomycetes bacterium]|nr:glycoside hydrolase [Planctomycetota bacterium]
YAPERPAPGHAKPDFVGWSGLGPVAVLLEEVMGLQADMVNTRLTIDVSLLEEYGVKNYPFGGKGTLDIKVNSRAKAETEPEIELESSLDFELVVKWGEKEKSRKIRAGESIKV